VSAPNRIRVFLLSTLALACSASTAFALRADELLLIVNENVAESRALAEFYTAARLVPAGRIVALKLTDQEEMPFDAYERDVVAPLRTFLRERQLESQVKCLVTFYGVPLRVAGKVSTPADKQELEQLRKELTETRAALDGVIVEVETIARALDPTFTPHAGSPLDDAGRRADVSVRAGFLALGDLPDKARQRELAGKLVGLLQQLGGTERVGELLSKADALRELLPERPAPTTQDLSDARERVRALQEQRYDPEARRTLRELAPAALGLFGKARTLEAQIEYLDNDGTSAAVDSELSLLWWNYYSRSKWQPNPLYYNVRRQGVGGPRVLMTARLDAPQPETVRHLILASLRAERDGLKGKVVVDSRGIKQRESNGKPNGFGIYDQTLRNFASLVRTRTDLPLTVDDRDAMFPPNSVSNVAVYAGWYSLRNYVPSFTFIPGAVGYHVASFELQSLRTPNEKGWVANLLNNGVVATIGPVNEPYLHAFPAADEFLPLVLAGRLTLAEAYWRTIPMTSWMMSLIGDPLYRPFAVNPALRAEDLPDALRRGASGIGAVPAAASTTIPTIPTSAPASRPSQVVPQ
jgi:uncharacterized protein (TIGR03790 family)